MNPTRWGSSLLWEHLPSVVRVPIHILPMSGSILTSIYATELMICGIIAHLHFLATLLDIHWYPFSHSACRQMDINRCLLFKFITIYKAILYYFPCHICFQSWMQHLQISLICVNILLFLWGGQSINSIFFIFPNERKLNLLENIAYIFAVMDRIFFCPSEKPWHKQRTCLKETSRTALVIL